MINHSVDCKPGMYGISYSELKDHYLRFIRMNDKEFMAALPEVIHFACITCWLKEVGDEASIGEQGIVHELAHLLHHGEGYGKRKRMLTGRLSRQTNMAWIRKRFTEILKLA